MFRVIRFTKLIQLFFAMMLLPVVAFANTEVDTGDTTFVFVATTLVFLMTPGLAFFYGGLVRQKNVLNTMIASFVIIALISIEWILIGYPLAFGTDKLSLIGSLEWFGLSNVGFEPNSDYAATIPHLSFVLFQMMFAIITPALITGSFVERMRFSVLIVFALLWSILVYNPLCHWVWGINGWMRTIGILDFAGGTVVHISSGISGLVAAVMIGKRKGYQSIPMAPHNIPYVLLGTSLLWFGWFGFNAGSALGINSLTMPAFLNTNTAAAAGVLSWLMVEWIRNKKLTIVGACTGAIVGLIAITPAAGFVTPLSSIIIGALASPVCYFAVNFIKEKYGYDDSLDAFGCHGIGGIFGALATGIFATKTVNPLGADGALYGNFKQLLLQGLGVLATVAFCILMTYIILKGISLFKSLRIDSHSEEKGLDLKYHGEEAYTHKSA